MSATTHPTRWPHTRAAYAIVIGSWLVYAILTLAAPDASNSRYHMSALGLALLRLTIILPIHLVWLIALGGAIAFTNYATLINGSPEAKGLRLIASGLMWTVTYLVTLSLLSSVEPFFTTGTPAKIITILTDHVPVFVVLIAFILLYLGSHQLRAVAKFTTWTRNTILVTIAYGVFAIWFVWLFSSDTSIAPGRHTSLAIVPHGLLLITLILPQLAGWFLGTLAAINILKFSRSVKGVLYRKALHNLVLGIASIIAFASAVQIVTFDNRYFASISFAAVLAIVYAFIALYAVGFVFIWIGAKKLARLEALE